MTTITRANIIEQLRKEILPLQGFGCILNKDAAVVDIGPINQSFPRSIFPIGAIHEFLCNAVENVAASSGFISGILSSLMRNSGITLWVRSSQAIYPPALQSFGVAPDKVIFITLKKQKDILWTIEEALKCEGLSAVVGEMRDFNFTTSRRFQLAVEQSRVTGFIITNETKHQNTTASLTRWKITSVPCLPEPGLPGVGFPCWNVELLKVRNGKPGVWQMEWAADHFKHIADISIQALERQRKTG